MSSPRAVPHPACRGRGWLALWLVLGHTACHKVPRNDSATTKPRVIIVGAGLAGLVTAYALDKQGIRAHLIEERTSLGGRVATATYDVGTAESGMQEMWAGNPLTDIVKELGLAVDPAESPFSSVILDKTLYPYVQATNEAYFASIFSPAEKAAWDAFNAHATDLYERARRLGLRDPEVATLQDLAFGAWVAQSALPARVAAWLRLTVECELAASWDAFSALSGLLDMDMFLGPGQANYHIRGGNSRVVAALAQHLHGPTTLGATVTHVSRRQSADGAWHATVTFQKDNVVQQVEAERVVVAVPFVRLHQIFFDPPLPADTWQAVNTLRFGQYAVVHFVVDAAARPLWQQGGNPFPVLAGGSLGVIYGVSPDAPADAKQDIFSLLVYGDAAKTFHMVPRTSKAQALIAELDSRWPGLAKHIQATHMYTYHPAALPVWPPGRSPIDSLAEQLRQPTAALYLAGDYTRGAHSTGAVQRGLEVARALGVELATAPAAH